MTAYSFDDETEQLLQLSEEVGRIAGALAGLSVGLPGLPDSSEDKADASEASTRGLDFVIRARSERARYVPRDLLADPAWDMILDLLQSEIRGRHTSVSDLCLVAGVPMTTALRWISKMEQRKLVTRERDRSDGRRILIKLIPEVSAGLRRYFAALVEAA